MKLLERIKKCFKKDDLVKKFIDDVTDYKINVTYVDVAPLDDSIIINKENYQLLINLARASDRRFEVWTRETYAELESALNKVKKAGLI
jgi:hypothetical protein